MPKKRRNNGHRIRGSRRGHINRIKCDICGCNVAKDKAIRKDVVRNIISPAIMKDVLDASVYKNYQIPKIYYKSNYCISCAVHRRIVKK